MVFGGVMWRVGFGGDALVGGNGGSSQPHLRLGCSQLFSQPAVSCRLHSGTEVGGKQNVMGSGRMA